VSGYYSFVVRASQPVGITDPFVLLDKGRTVFNAAVKNLNSFLEELKDEGVEVLQVNRLDQSEPLSAVEETLLGGGQSSSPPRLSGE
jgi:hypothetical protein